MSKAKGFGKVSTRKLKERAIAGTAKELAKILKASAYISTTEEVEASVRLRRGEASRRDVAIVVGALQKVGIVQPLDTQARLQLIDVMFETQKNASRRDHQLARRFTDQIEAQLRGFMGGAES